MEVILVDSCNLISINFVLKKGKQKTKIELCSDAFLF